MHGALTQSVVVRGTRISVMSWVEAGCVCGKWQCEGEMSWHHIRRLQESLYSFNHAVLAAAERALRKSKLRLDRGAPAVESPASTGDGLTRNRWTSLREHAAAADAELEAARRCLRNDEASSVFLQALQVRAKNANKAVEECMMAILRDSRRGTVASDNQTDQKPQVQ